MKLKTGSGRSHHRSPFPDHPLKPESLLLLVQDQLRTHLRLDAPVVATPLALPAARDVDVARPEVLADEAQVDLLLLRSSERVLQLFVS